jgi:inner membrane protein
MPSSIGHASVAILLAPMLWHSPLSRPVVFGVAIAAAIPDIDAIGRPFGRGDLAVFEGHRAVTHSVWFALLLGGLALPVARRFSLSTRPGLFALYVALVVLSHGCLDALSTYGEGVAFFAPLSRLRWKAPWQPFSGLVPEMLFLWLPALVLYHLWMKAWLLQNAPASYAA